MDSPPLKQGDSSLTSAFSFILILNYMTCSPFRTAMPYGGYEKASKRMTFQMPKFDLGPLLSEPLVLYNQNLSNRPSFNRTPIPWLSSGEHVDYSVDIGIPLDGETEEL